MNKVKKVYYCQGDTKTIITKSGEERECIEVDITLNIDVAKTYNTYRIATLQELNDNLCCAGEFEGLLEVQEGIYQWFEKCDYDEDLDEFINDGEYIKIKIE